MKRTFVSNLRRFSLAVVLAGGWFGAAALSHAADVSAYSVQKGRLYSQTSPAAPLPIPSTSFLFTAFIEGNLDAITEASVRTPSPFLPGIDLEPNSSDTRREFTLPAQGPEDLSFLAPNGTYTFLYSSENDGDDNPATLDLNSSTLPSAIPQISNYTAAQSISATAAFTLSFNAHGGSGPNDRFELVITDEDEVEVYSDSGAGASAVIPAGTLSPVATTYKGTLRFVRELQRDSSTYPGATGTAELFNQTEFSLKTGSGGGETDVIAPLLFLVTPQLGATNISGSATVTFTFSEPMANTHAIEWSANVNTTALTYNWTSASTLSITSQGAFPTNSVITWKLNPNPANPANFRDPAGNFLATTQGAFNTGASGAVDPCDQPGGGEDDGRGFGNIFKSLQYVQTNNAAPVLDVGKPASFTATYRGASNQTVTAASLSGPGGNLTLTNLSFFFLASREFATPAQLETAFPPGNYTLTATGAGAATVAIGNVTQIPIPRINNLTALMGMDVTKDFTLTFAPFTGAGVQDGIFISIFGETGQGEFHAPDLCRKIELPNTATSVVIPANTFKAGQKYDGSISFSRNAFNTNSIPNTGIFAGGSVTTSFDFTSTGGVQPTRPTWSSFTRNLDGTITYTIQGDIGINLSIETSDNVASGWTQFTTAILATGSHQFTVDSRTPAKRFFRARVL